MSNETRIFICNLLFYVCGLWVVFSFDLIIGLQYNPRHIYQMNYIVVLFDFSIIYCQKRLNRSSLPSWTIIVRITMVGNCFILWIVMINLSNPMILCFYRPAQHNFSNNRWDYELFITSINSNQSFVYEDPSWIFQYIKILAPLIKCLLCLTEFQFFIK